MGAEKGLKMKVVTVGNCMKCGKEIKLKIPEGCNKFPNIFFCKECEEKWKMRDK